MKTVASLVKQNPLISFVVLTYLFSWWPALLYWWGIDSPGVAGFGPFLAALVVLALTEGKPGVKTLLRRMVHWRVGWPWYLVAFGLPILMAAIASYLTVLLGAPTPSVEQLAAEDLGSLPMAVLWASESGTNQAGYAAYRQEVAGYSTNSVTHYIEGADHGSILGNAQYAQQVSAAILAVIDAAQTGAPLAMDR